MGDLSGGHLEQVIVTVTGAVGSQRTLYGVKSLLVSMTRTAHATRWRSRSHPRLSVAVIVDAAVQLIEREGAAALSMRRLGAGLGVEAMALYHHIASREDLVRAIGDRLLEPLHELELPDDWRASCRLFAIALRDIALGRPATFRLVGLHPLDTASSLLPVERLLGVLVGQGFAPADALGIYRAVASYGRGYALAEATGFTVDAGRPAGRERLNRLAVDAFPILAGRSEELAALDAAAGFTHGLDALLSGLPEPS